MPKITIIVPCYQNELNIPVTGEKLIADESLFEPGVEFEYIFIDDGSKDKTFDELLAFQKRHADKVKLIKLTRNFSSTNAVFAALPFASGDCCVVMSADLQDPSELISKMYAYWKQGIKLVVANRIRRHDPLISRVISKFAHSLIRSFALGNLPRGGFDMNLFDRDIANLLMKIEDKNSYFPYLLMWTGYDYVSIPYERKKRELGISAYTFSKKIRAFVDSFVAFSYFPVRLISISGILLGCAALFYAMLVIASKFYSGNEIPGWASLMVILLFVSSFQMIALGIIGEYVWRSLDSSRKRPNFIIEKTVGCERGNS